jgi:5-(carboxyamino)imidazole ribonucleotide synthase
MALNRPTVAVFGGGQLGRMLVLAGHSLGLNVHCLDPARDACAGQVGPLTVNSYTNYSALPSFLEGTQAVTLEFENVPLTTLEFAEKKGFPVYPSSRAVAIAQDRVTEKKFVRELGFKTTEFVAIDSEADVELALPIMKGPAYLKTRRSGYDGKGQRYLETPDGLADAVHEMGGQGLILESAVNFVREVSLVSVRGRDGTIAHYPLIENRHKNGILRVSRVDDAKERPATEPQAREIAKRIMTALNYVGVLAIEFFEIEVLAPDGKTKTLQLLVNEIAPRVHNSGHWTIDASTASQFENHLRAILGWDLGPTDALGYTGMVNLIGEWVNPQLLVSGLGDAKLHFYGKDPRPGRKVGHVTVRAETPEGRENAIRKIMRYCKFHRLGLLEAA